MKKITILIILAVVAVIIFFAVRQPSSQVTDEVFVVDNIYNTWVNEPGPDVPHATFVLSPESYYLVDYDGDANRPYDLNGNRLTVYYEDFEQQGTILEADGETLVIEWDNFGDATTYYLWQN